MISSLEQGKKFSKIDLRQAYFQLPLDEASKPLTTINTSKGLYVFNRLVFGITSSPAIWQKTIDQVLKGLQGVLCNQDDMIVFGKTDEEHHSNLTKVLQRLQDCGIRANRSKCSFYKDEVIYCGIKVTSKGLHKTEDKIKAVQDAPEPTTKSNVRSFLGLVNYYHKWLPNISTISKPLYDLLQNNTPFEWTDKCQTAFDTIKNMVASDLVLTHYDPELPLTLATDASPYGIGAVLSHTTAEGEKPVAFASRTLSKAEQNYSQLDKEALAIVWAVKKFFFYICGRHFTLITDHQPLKYIFSPDKGIPAMSAARQQRYAAFLSGFNYSIEYRTSKANANADSLSRLPLTDQWGIEVDTSDLFYKDVLDSAPVSPITIARESRHDTILSQVMNFINNDNWPNQIAEELRSFHKIRHELTIQQDCLLWGYRVVPPSKLRPSILQTLHVGHLGIAKMKNLARNYVWWPAMDKDIEMISKSCSGCAMSQPDPLHSPLHPWQWPDKPWQRIHIDFAGPFMSSMFLIVVDAHTKWTEIIPTSSTTSSATINILGTIFARFGLPEHLVSDNGAQFTSEEFAVFVRSNGIKHTKTAPYHPATNGLAERMVQTFKSAMKSAKDDKGNVYTKLARFLLAYRNAPHSTTGETPASLMFGRKLRTKIDQALPDIRTKVSTSQSDQVKSHSQAALRLFDIGDKVLVRDYRQHQQRWKHGTIYAQTGSRSYEVEVAPGVIWRRHCDQMVHTSSSPSSLTVPEPILTPTPTPLHIDIPVQNPTSEVKSSSTPPQTMLPSMVNNRVEQKSSPSPSPRDTQTRVQNCTTRTRSGRVVKVPARYSD